ncbi:MAG: hypothetical protein AAFR87_11750 [Bacteroidota bacterium]
MRLFLHLTLGSILILLFIQCQPDRVIITPGTSIVPITPADPDTTNNNLQNSGDTIHISTDIIADETWLSNNTYILDTMITVTNNAKLTIESCVVVKAAYGATGLIIDQGADIDAQGTASCPIIFTSVNDSLIPGDIVSPNLTGADHGLWGGIFILGEAPVSTMSSPSILQYLLGGYTYGGQSTSDNSGIFTYVSIRHTGFETAPYETPCGLLLAGVGSASMIDHVELYANSDDGFVILGGTVNINHVVTSHFNDDGFDCDKGYAGTMDNLIGIGGNGRDASLELDGGEGATNPSFTIRNASFKGSQDGEYYVDFQKNVNCLIENSYFFGFDEASEVILERDIDADNWLAGDIDVLNLEFNTSHLTSGNTTIGTIFVDRGLNGNDAFTLRLPSASIVTSPSVGANKADFAGWTVADLSGALTDF